MDINGILDVAIKERASDVHLICGRKPTLRISKELKEIETEELTKEDMYEIYDYFIRGEIIRDKIYEETRQLDISDTVGDVRLRINISSARRYTNIYNKNYKKYFTKIWRPRNSGHSKKNDVSTTRSNISYR